MNIIHKIKGKIPKFLKRKRNIWLMIIGAVVLFILYLIFGPKDTTGSIQVGTAEKKNLQETVLATGQVVSGTDLDLSFQGSGIIRKIAVKEGDVVYKGQLLAYLDQSTALATLTIAQGSLAQAKANYAKLVAGATQENIQTVKDSIAAAEQDLNNAYSGGLNTLSSAYTTMYNTYSVVLSVQNTYFYTSDQQSITVLDKRNDILNNVNAIKVYLDKAWQSKSKEDIDSAISQMTTVLNVVYNDTSIVRASCDQGQYYNKVSGTDKDILDAQKVTINTSLSSVSTLMNTIASYKIALQKAKDQLSVTVAPPTPAEVDSAKAQILSAQGQVDSAQATVNNTAIIAPASGTITQIDKKEGELAGALAEVMVLQDVGNLHAEADVSEANIASLNLGQTIDYTFDALGPDDHFAGKILTINPSSTVISGVVNYKIKGSLDNIPQLKPGMTANMTILVATKDNALAVPSTAVINKNGKQYVRVIDDPKKKTYHEVLVQTGMEADGGLIEIISGISEGETIITYMK